MQYVNWFMLIVSVYGTYLDVSARDFFSIQVSFIYLFFPRGLALWPSLGALWPFPIQYLFKTTFNPKYVFWDPHVTPTIYLRTSGAFSFAYKHRTCPSYYDNTECFIANILLHCKQFCDHHNNYYIIIDNGKCHV